VPGVMAVLGTLAPGAPDGVRLAVAPGDPGGSGWPCMPGNGLPSGCAAGRCVPGAAPGTLAVLGALALGAPGGVRLTVAPGDPGGSGWPCMPGSGLPSGCAAGRRVPGAAPGCDVEG